MFKPVLIAALLLSSAQALTVKRSNIILNYAPILGFSYRIEVLLGSEFPKPERLLEADVTCDGVRVSSLQRADEQDLAAWKKQFVVAGRSVRLGSTTVGCVNGRLEVRAGNPAALLNRFPAYAWTEEQEALLRATDRLPALTLFKDGVEFMGFLFLFEKGKVTTEQKGGLMAVSQGGAPKPLLFDGKLTPLTLDPAKPYTLHTSLTESSVWSNLHVDPAQGRVTVWSSRAPGK